MDFQQLDWRTVFVLIFRFNLFFIEIPSWVNYRFVIENNSKVEGFSISHTHQIRTTAQQKLSLKYHSQEAYQSANSLKIVARIIVVLSYLALILYPLSIKVLVLDLFSIFHFFLGIALQYRDIDPYMFAIISEFKYLIGLNWISLRLPTDPPILPKLNLNLITSFYSSSSLFNSVSSVISISVMIISIMMIAFAQHINVRVEKIMLLSGFSILFFSFDFGLTSIIYYLCTTDSIFVSMAKILVICLIQATPIYYWLNCPNYFTKQGLAIVLSQQFIKLIFAYFCYLESSTLSMFFLYLYLFLGF